MKFAKKTANLLQLKSIEQRLLALLNADHGINISTLSRAARVPRATVTFVLNKLNRRGLVITRSVGKRRQWILSSNDARLKLTRNLLQSFAVGLMKDGGTFVEVGQGMESIRHTYRQLVTLGRGERMYAIQGDRSVELSLKKITSSFFQDLHRIFKKKTVIIEGAIGERALSYFREMSDSDLRSHYGRAVVVTVLPDEYMDFDEDIFVYKDIVVLINFFQETVVTMRNSFMAEAIKRIIKVFHDTGKKIDLNAVILQEIERRKVN